MARFIPALAGAGFGAARHRHVVDRGGDVETRPKNAAVYWIICKE